MSVKEKVNIVKCEYFDCNNEAKHEIKTTFENKPYIIKACRKCYKEYLKA